MKKQNKIDPWHFETGEYRPPSEGGSSSLLVRLTRNCPWNHCTFCAMYKGEKFELRSPSKIMGDIDAMGRIASGLREISLGSGQKGILTSSVVSEFFRKTPDLNFHPGVGMLISFLAAGGKTAFLQDADSLIMKAEDLAKVLIHLKTVFPSIERITSYGRSRTLARKPAQDLALIRKAGLDRIHIGLETGDADLLKLIKKGSTPEDHVKGGKKAMEAGFQVSEYWMPGLGGKTRSKDHALNTAKVLNLINPHYIRSRPFTPRPGTIFYENADPNDLDRMTPGEQLEEIHQTLEALEVTSRICFDHAGNYWSGPDGRLLLSQSYEGYAFPGQKVQVLALIEGATRYYS
jgi:radical SAM superfamily enzyme YgiQ (UPF0313 family)